MPTAACPISKSDIAATQLVVGLEIHVELATRSKMFTAAPNVAHPEFDASEPNTLTDPLVLGMPGTLPVINKRAVEMSILLGLAMNCDIARFTKWDRKSYYYPDLPKNYQLSQYDLPLVGHGKFTFPWADSDGKEQHTTVGITRAHLEEDAGKLMHEAPGGTPIDYSIVDLNRAGTPLLEIVTEPDFHSAEQAVAFCQRLRDMVRYLGISEAVMQKGHMRFEPNINLHITTSDGQTFKTPVVEIKNLNSFRAVLGSIKHEQRRQLDAFLEDGKEMGAGAKSTRGWDDANTATILQREKEDAHDYRYFPDPDLVPLTIDDDWLEQIEQDLKEMPWDKRHRYTDEYGLDEKAADQLLDDPGLVGFYERVIAAGGEPKASAALLLNALAQLSNERGHSAAQLGVTPEQVTQTLQLVADDKLGSSNVGKLLGYCCDAPGTDAAKLAEQHNLLQMSDTGALEGEVDKVLADAKNAKIVEDIKAGKGKAVGALMGQIMKATRGQANPKVVTEMIQKKLNG